MKKHILIFAHYYYPDTASTGQLLQDQAEGMLDEFDVTVIATVPSYGGTIEAQYKEKKFYHGTINGVEIIRVRVPEFSKESKLSRIKNILSYFVRALIAARRVKNVDYVFTISQPPMLGGLLGVLGKRILRNGQGEHPKLIYCIQDFNPEQIQAVGYIHNRFILNTMMALDKHSCKASDLVITVGRDLVQTLKRRFVGKSVPRYAMINNWIDEKEIYPLASSDARVVDWRRDNGLEGCFVIMYSGNIGLYYDLQNLIKVAESFKEARTSTGRPVRFAFVGGGAVLDNLKKYAADHDLYNVVFIPYQDKNQLLYSLNAADVHWCVNAKGIKGVSCPSKFYGIIAVGKPVLGVLEKGSEVQMLIDEIGCGCVCEPGDYVAVQRNVEWFINHAEDEALHSMGMNGYSYLKAHLTKDISVQRYIEAIKGL